MTLTLAVTRLLVLIQPNQTTMATVEAVVADLKPLVSREPTILDNNPDSTNPAWFPRKIRELVCAQSFAV